MAIHWLIPDDSPIEYDIQIRKRGWFRRWRTIARAQVVAVIAIHWSRVRIGQDEIARLRMNGRTIGTLKPVYWSAAKRG